MRTQVCLLALSLLLSWGSSNCTGTEADPRRPIPDEPTVKAARVLVREAYENDFLSSAENPEPLIEKLVTASGQTKDSARGYALLLEAEQAAAAADRHDRAMELVAVRAKEFQVDEAKARLHWLGEMFTANARREPTLLVSLYGHALQTAELGLLKEELVSAEVAAELSSSIAKALYLVGKAKKADSLAADGESKQREAKELLQAVRKRIKLFEEYEQAAASLEVDPASTIANSTVGSYLCFYRDDWKNGLSALAKGTNKQLAALAIREQNLMSAEQPEAKSIFGLAGEWWDMAEGKDHESAMRQHAADLYSRCLAGLADPLDVAIATKRAAGVQNLKSQVPQAAKLVPPSLRRLSWSKANAPHHFLKQPTTRTWYELSANNKDWFRFKEVHRNQDYVELHDEQGRKMAVRLWENKSEWATFDKISQWNDLGKGVWADEEAVGRLLEKFRPSVRLLFFPFEGKRTASGAEAKQMLEWLGAKDVVLHQGGLVTGKLDPQTEIAIWPQTYKHEYCYGIRHGDLAKGRSYFSSNETYFEICRPQ